MVSSLFLPVPLGGTPKETKTESNSIQSNRIPSRKFHFTGIITPRDILPFRTIESIESINQINQLVTVSSPSNIDIDWTSPPPPPPPGFASPSLMICCCNTMLYTLAFRSVYTVAVLRSSMRRPSRVREAGDPARSAREEDN